MNENIIGYVELNDEELEQVSGGLGNLKNPIVYIGKAL